MTGFIYNQNALGAVSGGDLSQADLNVISSSDARAVRGTRRWPQHGSGS